MSDDAQSAALKDALGPIQGFLDDYFSPWGSWKTPWWEYTVGDEVAFSDHAALRHVQKLVKAALGGRGAEPPCSDAELGPGMNKEQEG